MQLNKKEQLESNGWRVGSSSEFLGLTAEEELFVELKLNLCRTLREMRVSKKLTQKDIAKMINSSQSRVAKMEAADSTVSVDLVIKSLLTIGATKQDLAKAILEAA